MFTLNIAPLTLILVWGQTCLMVVSFNCSLMVHGLGFLLFFNSSGDHFSSLACFSGDLSRTQAAYNFWYYLLFNSGFLPKKHGSMPVRCPLSRCCWYQRQATSKLEARLTTSLMQC